MKTIPQQISQQEVQVTHNKLRALQKLSMISNKYLQDNVEIMGNINSSTQATIKKLKVLADSED